jgi:hypothetical protein
MVRTQTKVILENKPAYKVTRNNNDLFHRQTAFITANQIAATCSGCTKQAVCVRKCKKKKKIMQL